MNWSHLLMFTANFTIYYFYKFIAEEIITRGYEYMYTWYKKTQRHEVDFFSY